MGTAILIRAVVALALFALPYVEVFGAAGGTDLRVHAGYRLQHVSNGNTDLPNRGFESHAGVFGISFFLP